jgi:hypothetical protein
LVQLKIKKEKKFSFLNVGNRSQICEELKRSNGFICECELCHDEKSEKKFHSWTIILENWDAIQRFEHCKEGIEEN